MPEYDKTGSTMIPHLLARLGQSPMSAGRVPDEDNARMNSETRRRLNARPLRSGPECLLEIFDPIGTIVPQIGSARCHHLFRVRLVKSSSRLKIR